MRFVTLKPQGRWNDGLKDDNPISEDGGVSSFSHAGLIPLENPLDRSRNARHRPPQGLRLLQRGATAARTLRFDVNAVQNPRDPHGSPHPGRVDSGEELRVGFIRTACLKSRPRQWADRSCPFYSKTKREILNPAKALHKKCGLACEAGGSIKPGA